MKLQNVIQISIVIVCLGLLPKSQAVVPAPDGGYPGGNTAEGQTALLSLTTGEFNTAVGFFSLGSNTAGSFNTGVGAGTLLSNTGDQTFGEENTATGAGALLSNTTGFQNTANGAFALFNNSIGVQNTATGKKALFSNIDGNGNTAVGEGTLISSTGSGNTALGGGAGIAITTADNTICLGSVGSNVSNSCFIGQVRGKTTAQNNAIPVLIDSLGQLGTVSSSRRFKKEIKAMDKASEAILALKPVTFHYKSDNTNRPEFGLIAEQVADVNPDLVVRDENGEIYTVRYDAVNAMLLNEFLKEHRKAQEQDATVTQLKSVLVQQQKGFDSKLARQQKQIEALIAGLQKVNAQMEVSKPIARMALNNP